MFEQTIKFDRKSDADLFDQHILDFLKHCEDQNQQEDACLFSTRENEQGHHVRVVKTDSPRMLGRLLNFLTVKDFPSSLLFSQQKEEFIL